MATGKNYSEINERDKLFLQLLAIGKTDREIAQIAGISYATVKMTFPNIMAKLGAVNRYNALFIAFKKKLIK